MKKYRANNAVVPLIAVAISALTLVVYLPALKNGFVNWDDGRYVYSNTHIASLDMRFLKWAFTTFEFGNWHPLTWISYSLDYSIWGLDPTGYHLTNAVLHCLNTFLVVVLAWLLIETARPETTHLSPTFGKGGNRGMGPLIAALVTGILFGLHPLHVESVAWISERKDVLYSFFYLACLLFYVRYASGRGPVILYWLSLAAFIMSLLSKPMAVTLPIVLFILDFCPLNRLRRDAGSATLRRAVLEKLPFLFAALTVSILTILAQAQSDAVVGLESLYFKERPLVALRAIFFYIEKLLWPASLSPYYPLKFPITFTIKDLGYIGLVFALALPAVTSRWKKVWIAAWCYYLITLAPVLGLFQVGTQAAADRYTYLPLLAPMFLIGLGAAVGFRKVSGMTRWKTVLSGLFILVILAGFAAMSGVTLRQVRIWNSGVSLWSRVIDLFPFDSFLPYIKRGQAFNMLGDYNNAIRDYTLSIQMAPQYGGAYYNRSLAYRKAGSYELALRDVEEALRRPPDDPAILNKVIRQREFLRQIIAGKKKSKGNAP